MWTCRANRGSARGAAFGSRLQRAAASAGWLMGVGLCLLLPAVQAADLAWEDVVQQARDRAAAPYQSTSARVPDWLMELNYRAWQDIRFDPNVALWAGQERGFSVRFHHPGSIYRRPVAISEVDGGKAQPLHFAPGQFFYGPGVDRQRVPGNLGYAGFTVYAQQDGKWQPVLEFLGGSFMRGGAPLTPNGARARALAIDTGLPSGEEFPIFTDFWLVRPPSNAQSLTIYALLDSPRVSGAYRIELSCGIQTVTQVTSEVFFRDTVRKLGLGALSSMFWYGANGPSVDDYRPQVHSSDGLLLQAGTHWLWRPLVNLPRLALHAWPLAEGAGYGLLQRERDFDRYQDIEAAYEAQPGVFLQPQQGFGTGRLELLELPVRDGLNQNVLAYFVPRRKMQAGGNLALRYRLTWGNQEPGQPGGRVLATRHAPQSGESGTTVYQIDFAALGGDPAAATQARVNIEGGELRQQRLSAWGDGWRLTLGIRRDDAEPLLARAVLVAEKDVRSETWVYQLAGE